MYTRIIEIEGVLDPIAVNITEEEDHYIIDEKLADLNCTGQEVTSDETLEMPGATKGKSILRFIEIIQIIIDKGDEDGTY